MSQGVWSQSVGLTKGEGEDLRQLMGPTQPSLEAADGAEMKLALLQRLWALDNPAPKPAYQTDFHRFLIERVWTKDEAAGGKVARVPPWPLFADLAADLVIEPKLFIEKSRRVMATWLACAFDVWLAAGGQDPRWVNEQGKSVLLNATGNRRIFVESRKYEDSCYLLRHRIGFIIDNLLNPPEGPPIQQFWPEFPRRWQFKENEIAADNGSVITALGQGADQSRSYGVTALHFEEVAFWEMAQQAIEGAIPTLRGGGHIYCITTAQAGTYAASIVAEQVTETLF